MKRVYLDQMHWISLTRARLGHPMGAASADTLMLAQALVDGGDVSFPLGMMHYIETSKRGRWESRRDLAETMRLLSRMHTIAPQNSLVDQEIAHAVRQLRGLPAGPPVRPFGVGCGFAFDLPTDDLPLKAPDELAAQLPPGLAKPLVS